MINPQNIFFWSSSRRLNNDINHDNKFHVTEHESSVVTQATRIILIRFCIIMEHYLQIIIIGRTILAERVRKTETKKFRGFVCFRMFLLELYRVELFFTALNSFYRFELFFSIYSVDPTSNVLFEVSHVLFFASSTPITDWRSYEWYRIIHSRIVRMIKSSP